MGVFISGKDDTRRRHSSCDPASEVLIRGDGCMDKRKRAFSGESGKFFPLFWKQVSCSGEKVDLETIQCALDMVRLLTETEQELHGMTEPEETAQQVMKRICSFYQAEFVGMLDVDVEMNSWSPKWWYADDDRDPALAWIKDMETGDYAASWKAAFRDNRPVIITDIRSVEKSHPEEYEMYRRLRVENVIGVPYYKYSKGFVVVKNPGCYKNQTALLYFLTYVLMAELNEYKLIQAISHGAYKCNIRHPNEVRIHLFGGFTLINFEGIHMAHEFPPDELELLMYLAMNPHKAFPAAVLSALVWPGADPGNGGKARRAVSNNRKRGINLSGHHLIVTTSAGYRLNPELKISIDLSVFDQLEQAAAIVNDDAAVQLLENMMDIYTGGIQITNKDLSWLKNARTVYNDHYVKAVSRLLGIYFMKSNYKELHKKAEKSLAINPANTGAYYWRVRAYRKQNWIELANEQLNLAREFLLKEEYAGLLYRLEKAEEKEEK